MRRKESKLAAVAANGGALRRLELRNTPLRVTKGEDDLVSLSKVEVDGVLHAASALLSFDADVACSLHDAQSLLAGQGQYSVLHIRRLFLVDCSREEAARLAHTICLHPTLEEVGIVGTPLDTPAVLGALVDAAIAHGLRRLYFSGTHRIPQPATHFARLLRDAPRLSMLLLTGMNAVDAASEVAFAAALPASTLKVLRLEDLNLWERYDPGGPGHTLVDALVGHPTLQNISLAHNAVPHEQFDPQNTVGECLARLLAANTPSLHTLHLDSIEARSFNVRPLFAALTSNTHLRTLFMRDNELYAGFRRIVMLPCVCASVALRRRVRMEAGEDGDPPCVESLVFA